MSKLDRLDRLTDLTPAEITLRDLDAKQQREQREIKAAAADAEYEELRSGAPLADLRKWHGIIVPGRAHLCEVLKNLPAVHRSRSDMDREMAVTAAIRAIDRGVQWNHDSPMLPYPLADLIEAGGFSRTTFFGSLDYTERRIAELEHRINSAKERYEMLMRTYGDGSQSWAVVRSDDNTTFEVLRDAANPLPIGAPVTIKAVDGKLFSGVVIGDRPDLPPTPPSK